MVLIRWNGCVGWSVLIRPLVKNAYQKSNFLISQPKNICCGYSKEPSQWDGSFEHPKHMRSFEHPKHMLKIMGKKIFTFLRWKCLFIRTYVSCNKIKFSHIKALKLFLALPYWQPIPYLPTSQPLPQCPVTLSQSSPFLQWHVNLHFQPNLPSVLQGTTTEKKHI